MSILRELFHFTLMIAKTMRVVGELGSDVAPDVAQPVEAVVFLLGLWEWVHGHCSRRDFRSFPCRWLSAAGGACDEEAVFIAESTREVEVVNFGFLE
jgi:hypothetical protein